MDIDVESWYIYVIWQPVLYRIVQPFHETCTFFKFYKESVWMNENVHETHPGNM